MGVFRGRTLPAEATARTMALKWGRAGSILGRAGAARTHL